MEADSFINEISAVDRNLERIAKLRKTLSEVGLSSDPTFFDSIAHQLRGFRSFLAQGEINLGDFVEFVEPYSFPPTHGWYGARHLFVPGVRAQVVGVSADAGERLLSVVFEKETYISPVSGTEVEVEAKAAYCRIPERRFRKV